MNIVDELQEEIQTIRGIKGSTKMQLIRESKHPSMKETPSVRTPEDTSRTPYSSKISGSKMIMQVMAECTALKVNIEGLELMNSTFRNDLDRFSKECKAQSTSKSNDINIALSRLQDNIKEFHLFQAKYKLDINYLTEKIENFKEVKPNENQIQLEGIQSQELKDIIHGITNLELRASSVESSTKELFDKLQDMSKKMKSTDETVLSYLKNFDLEAKIIKMIKQNMKSYVSESIVDVKKEIHKIKKTTVAMGDTIKHIENMQFYNSKSTHRESFHDINPSKQRVVNKERNLSYVNELEASVQNDFNLQGTALSQLSITDSDADSQEKEVQMAEKEVKNKLISLEKRVGEIGKNVVQQQFMNSLNDKLRVRRKSLFKLPELPSAKVRPQSQNLGRDKNLTKEFDQSLQMRNIIKQEMKLIQNVFFEFIGEEALFRTSVIRSPSRGATDKMDSLDWFARNIDFIPHKYFEGMLRVSYQVYTESINMRNSFFFQDHSSDVMISLRRLINETQSSKASPHIKRMLDKYLEILSILNLSSVNLKRGVDLNLSEALSLIIRRNKIGSQTNALGQNCLMQFCTDPKTVQKLIQSTSFSKWISNIIGSSTLEKDPAQYYNIFKILASFVSQLSIAKKLLEYNPNFPKEMITTIIYTFQQENVLMEHLHVIDYINT